jgi:hypothetical protein
MKISKLTLNVVLFKMDFITDAILNSERIFDGKISRGFSVHFR